MTNEDEKTGPDSGVTAWKCLRCAELEQGKKTPEITEHSLHCPYRGRPEPNETD